MELGRARCGVGRGWGRRWLGRIAYGAGLDEQAAARARVMGGGPDELLLLEHESVVTLGRRGGVVDEVALARLRTPVVATDRGGLATWHGPGQLVAYPIFDLRRRGVGVPAFVRALGRAMAQAAARFGVRAAYDDARPGVYVDGRKLGSLGLHVSHGVSTHGIALNVDCDLAGFQAIDPCGEAGLVITTLARERPAGARAPALAEVADAFEAGLRAALGG